MVTGSELQSFANPYMLFPKRDIGGSTAACVGTHRSTGDRYMRRSHNCHADYQTVYRNVAYCLPFNLYA
jgi:hypothetical protein